MSDCVPSWAPLEYTFDRPPTEDEKRRLKRSPLLWARDSCFEPEILHSYEIAAAYLWIEGIINEVCDEVDQNTVSKDLNSMDGVEYEKYCKDILEDAGWEVEDTPITGDQGVNLIASIEDLRVCIQCKCFAKPVGNKAVQEIAAGKTHWKGTHAVVVAKSGFTKAAKQLAESTDEILLNDIELADLENRVL